MEKINVVDYVSYGYKDLRLKEEGGYDASNVGDIDGELCQLGYLGYDCHFDIEGNRIVLDDEDEEISVHGPMYGCYRCWLHGKEEDLKETPEEEAKRFQFFAGLDEPLDRGIMIGLERAWEYFAYKGRSEI